MTLYAAGPAQARSLRDTICETQPRAAAIAKAAPAWSPAPGRWARDPSGCTASVAPPEAVRRFLGKPRPTVFAIWQWWGRPGALGGSESMKRFMGIERGAARLLGPGYMDVGDSPSCGGSKGLVRKTGAAVAVGPNERSRGCNTVAGQGAARREGSPKSGRDLKNNIPRRCRGTPALQGGGVNQ